ncbi:SDR family oxidoreductase [Chloroflexota bacterium]
MILITGAAGKTGQAIIRALVKREMAVRAFVYRHAQTTLVKELGAKEVVVGDIRDEATFRQATRGVRAMYHICPNMNPDEVAIGRTAIAAASAAGVQHFVCHSVLHPQTEAMPHHWHKLRIEEMLFESGLDFTILQPAAYMQNILAGWTTIVEQGVYWVPYPVETRLGMVDLEDVATVAAAVLTEPGHVGATYELAGPEALTQTEIAAILSQVLDRSVRAEQMPLAVWRQQAQAAGLGAYQVETLVKMFRYYEQYNFWGNPQVLGWLLKRPPTGFWTFAEKRVSV